MKESILTTAHEWVQENYKPNYLVCTRCGFNTKVDDLPVSKRCIPHLEHINSGWQGEIIRYD